FVGRRFPVVGLRLGAEIVVDFIVEWFRIKRIVIVRVVPHVRLEPIVAAIFVVVPIESVRQLARRCRAASARQGWPRLGGWVRASCLHGGPHIEWTGKKGTL